MVGTVKKSTDTRLPRWFSEGPPCLGWRLPVPDEILAQVGFPDVVAELQQLAMNARRSSTRIFSADAANQVANLTWDRRTAWLASPDSRPEEAKCAGVPGNSCPV
jgi:hypothetical protein